MKKLTTADLRLMGSSSCMEDMMRMIKEKMYWSVEEVKPSEQFTCGRKECYDLVTHNGLKENVVIINEKGRYKLYAIL